MIEELLTSALLIAEMQDETLATCVRTLAQAVVGILSTVSDTQYKHAVIDDTGEGRFESRLKPGLFFLKHCDSVEFNDKRVELTRLQYHILDFLNDVGGTADIEYLVSKVWKKKPTDSTVRAVLSELGKKLLHIGIAAIHVIDGTVTF